jgi:cellulose synthase/poly-beta-1,6-N-acetylglucosamine synthase-like glycosyltransferase
MKISILIPCYNEELTIERCVRSCLAQTRCADQIVVVDDCSKDNTAKVLKKFKGLVKVVKTPKNTGGKSHAQEYGLQFVTGDVFIATDGDTVLQNDFVELVEKDMKDKSVTAVAGYVRSLKYNWITACRAMDYAISQNIDKLAQDYINFIFVIPGAAGAFRTKVFKKKMVFTHDTITEDLDFTYRLHKMGYKIKYNRKAICYTQDPTTLKAYINQMRRWFGGGWQNLIKHIAIPEKPGMAFELSLIYTEGLVFSVLLFVLPIINLYLAIMLLGIYCVILSCLSVFASVKERRPDFILVLPCYVFIKYVNAWVFLEQFIKEVIMGRKNLVWFKPDRVAMSGSVK